MTPLMQLTEEKIRISAQLIKLMEDRILNNDVLTHELLSDVKKEISHLQKTDF